MFPLQYAIYKGMGGKFGALQFNFQPPHYYNGRQRDFTGREAVSQGKGRSLNSGWKERQGCVFIEGAPIKEGQKNVYDWEKKIIMSLSPSDMGKILLTLATGQDCKIMHDPDVKSDNQGTVKKWLSIDSPNGTIKGVRIYMSYTSPEKKLQVSVPLSGSEVMVLKTLLQQAVIKSFNW